MEPFLHPPPLVAAKENGIRKSFVFPYTVSQLLFLACFPYFEKIKLSL
jgi:hypothetical protein